MFGDSEDKIMGTQIVLGTWDKETQIRLLEMEYH